MLVDVGLSRGPGLHGQAVGKDRAVRLNRIPRRFVSESGSSLIQTLIVFQRLKRAILTTRQFQVQHPMAGVRGGEHLVWPS